MLYKTQGCTIRRWGRMQKGLVSPIQCGSPVLSPVNPGSDNSQSHIGHDNESYLAVSVGLDARGKRHLVLCSQVDYASSM